MCSLGAPRWRCCATCEAAQKRDLGSAHKWLCRGLPYAGPHRCVNKGRSTLIVARLEQKEGTNLQGTSSLGVQGELQYEDK